MTAELVALALALAALWYVRTARRSELPPKTPDLDAFERRVGREGR